MDGRCSLMPPGGFLFSCKSLVGCPDEKWLLAASCEQPGGATGERARPVAEVP